MKKIVLLFILSSLASFAQKKELMIGSLSMMELSYDYENENYYSSDLQKSKTEIENFWNKSKLKYTKDGIQINKEFLSVDYLLKNDIVESKRITFQNFSDFFYYIQNIIKLNPEIKFGKSQSGNKYTFVDNGKNVVIETSFFYFENLDNHFDFDTLFKIEFRLE